MQIVRGTILFIQFKCILVSTSVERLYRLDGCRLVAGRLAAMCVRCVHVCVCVCVCV